MRAPLVPERDFRLLDASATREAARQTAEVSMAGHFIVRREAAGSSPTTYWVIDRETTLALLAVAGAKLAGTALKLHERDAALVVPARPLPPPVDRDQVLLVGDLPIGFIVACEAHRGGTTRDVVRLAGPSPAVRGDGDDRGPGHDAPHHLTRELSASWQDSVESGSDCALMVSLASLGAGAVTSAPLALEAGCTVTIVVRPLIGLRLMGSNTASLVVRDPQPDEPVVFMLSAGPIGPGAVRIYAFNGSRSIASFEMATSIVAAGAQRGPARAERVVATVPASARTAPDLALFVEEADGQIRYEIKGALADCVDRHFPPVPVPEGTRGFFLQFARDVENLAVDSRAQQVQAQDLMGKWGADLFQRLLPKTLRSALWQLRDRIGTVQITSDDAWIPWEACRLVGQDAAGRNIEGPFFAEAFAVTRWLHGAAAPDRFRFSEWALVVPQDSRLPLAPQEEAYVRGLARADRKVTRVPARFADVTRAMESEQFHAWHFCGHANAGGHADGDRAEIELDNDDRLPANSFAGRTENALRTGPFMFLNACQSARGGPTLTGVGGWAHRFIRPTFDRFAAAAFIGSYWSVYDTAAHGFARALYERLLIEGQAIGQAVRAARQAVRSPEDPLTWLAYTVYADPLAKAERSIHDTTPP